MRRRDRWFHLIVAVFALSLAISSAMILVSEGVSGRLQSWFQRFSLPAVSSMYERIVSQTQQTVTNWHDKSYQGKSSGNVQETEGKNIPSALSLIHVKAFNHNVSGSALENTRGLLEKNRIPSAIQKFLGIQLTLPATIELTNNKTDYQQALRDAGINFAEVKRLSLDTGGFTTNRTVIIPLYQNKDTPQLINTLSHELTHVYLNENGGSLPSWINEGLAVTMGMDMQSQSEAPLRYQGYARRMAEDVVQAERNRKLEPLAGSENTVISGSASYDVELQDWLAMRMLIAQKGDTSLHQFLALVHTGSEVPSAFQSAFGKNQETVNRDLTQLLQESSQIQDKGVNLSLSVRATYRGTIRILNHGSQEWEGFRLQSGTTKFSLLPKNKVLGITSKVAAVHDSQNPDGETVYLDLDSDRSLTYQGQSVKDAGFALDYHDGLYGFVNSWVTLSSGKTLYLSTPSLFGVQLQGVQERNQSNPVLPLLE